MTAQPEDRDLFFRALKDQTSEYHQKLEETSLSKIILSESVSLEAYMDYLHTMYAFVKPFEEIHFPLIDKFFPNLDARRRSHLLEKDLMKLGMSASELDETDFTGMNRSANPEEAVGAMYVVEGSSLGGRVILKHINKHLGLDEDSGASYFHGYGSETGPMWKSFLDELWSFAAQNPRQEVIDGAVKTFKDIYQLFSLQQKYAF